MKMRTHTDFYNHHVLCTAEPLLALLDKRVMLTDDSHHPSAFIRRFKSLHAQNELC
jgi:hypothetical protein